MRNLIPAIVYLILNTSLFAAASYDNNVNATELATQIQGEGITITNPQITRGMRSGSNSQIATFTNGIGGANLQIDEGILLTASTAKEAFSTNDSGRKSLNPGNVGPAGFDADLLSTISQNRIYNQVVFEFDVTLDANTRLLLIDYQFASDEYPEWVGSQFNDAFGFFISGGDLTQTYNIARVVDDSVIVTTANISNYPPVNINNVNRGAIGNQSNGSPVDLSNSNLFIDNGGTDVGYGGVNTSNAHIISEFDGFTKKLHATLDNLTPGQTYHFKMALADTSDTAWDAGVFVNKIVGVREPSLCYDYDVRVGANVTLPSNDDRSIETTVYPGEGLDLGIVLQSLEGEIDLLDANMTVLFNPNNSLRLDSAQISPDSINAYIPISDNLIQKIPNAKIPVGEDITSNGGTISANQIIFTDLSYDINSSGNLDVLFDINASMHLNLNGLIVPRSVSTLNGSLPRCPRQNGYQPEWAQFNVERNESKGDPILFTQISNRPFSVEVVSYDPLSTDISTEKKIEDVTLEVEIIDAENYPGSQGALFTCKKPLSLETGQLATFNTLSSRVLVPNPFNTQRALRSAAFRLWYLADSNNTIVKYTDTTASGFNTLYTTQFRDKIDTSPYKCSTACSSSTGTGTENNCYQCLKTYFAIPICSRDNFAIRPQSYRVTISDNNQSNNRVDPKKRISANDGNPILDGATLGGTTIATLAAEYSYIIDGNATQFNSDDNVVGYYGQFDANSQPETVSTLLFNQPGTCANTNDAPMDIIFRNGIISFVAKSGVVNVNGTNQFAHNNTGRYDYHIEDNNWTLVDQKRYQYKTFSGTDDCIYANDATMYATSLSAEQKSGCGISSSHSSQLNGRTYSDLPLRFEPYGFGLNGLKFTRRPNRDIVFMNDFNQTGYYTPPLSSKISMSISYDGNVTAVGFNQNVLSNFTTGCTASNVTLALTREMNPAENTLTDVPFQQFLEVGLNIVDTQTGLGGTVTLPAAAFLDVAQGQAPMRLYTTLKKPYGVGNAVNPIRVKYNELNATDSAAQSYAYMAVHTPDGNKTSDQNITYVYGKGTPLNRLYNNVEASSINTPLFADIYCSLGGTVCGNDFNLTQGSRGQQETDGTNWWLADVFNQNELGDYTLVVSHDAEKNANPSIAVNAGGKNTTINNVLFDDGSATQNDINVSVSGDQRPSTVRVDYSLPPWLSTYDSSKPPSNDFYRVRFIGPTSWTGVGKTGHVSDVESSDELRRKMNW